MERTIEINKYIDWINNYKGDIFRKYIEVCNEMKQQFPELQIRKGFVTIIDDSGKNEYPHMWLVYDNNKIIDPTAKQWVGIINYRKYVDDIAKVPIGRCFNCGKQLYGYLGNYKECCNDRCYNEYVNSVME